MKRICACNGVFLIVLVNMALAQSVAGLESLVDRLEHPLWTARLDAALAIAAGGPAATDAIPALTRTLDDVTLSVGPGEVHGLLGQNGIKEPSGETAPEVLGKGERVRTLEALLITPALVSTACT